MSPIFFCPFSMVVGGGGSLYVSQNTSFLREKYSRRKRAEIKMYFEYSVTYAIFESRMLTVLQFLAPLTRLRGRHLEFIKTERNLGSYFRLVPNRNGGVLNSAISTKYFTKINSSISLFIQQEPKRI